MQEEGKTRHEIKDSLGYKNLDSMTKYMRKRGYKVDEISVEMNERENGVSSIRDWKNISNDVGN